MGFSNICKVARGTYGSVAIIPPLSHAGADPGGGLRMLKHPPKLPKINYLLFNIVD